MLRAAQELAQQIMKSGDRAALGDGLAQAAAEMGFGYYALAQHPRSLRLRRGDLRVHNYAPEWEALYDRCGLGLSDPIHRASHIHGSGFRWRDVGSIIPATERDYAMLLQARSYGIAEGFTVPTNIPGEQFGSVTFATRVGDAFPEDMVIVAEALGHMAFQTARAIDGVRPFLKAPSVTDRQLEIVALIGRDKTDGEMAQILGVKQDTIAKHVRNICERFDAVKRTSVPLRALFHGMLTFWDIFP